MSETMMALGAYRFSIDSAAYQRFKRTQRYRWQPQARLSRVPAMQFVGQGEDNITLNGVIYPHFRGGLTQLDRLREEAAKGEPQLLVDGLGFIWGQWVVMSIDEEQQFFIANGQPLKQTFSLSLVFYGALPNSVE